MQMNLFIFLFRRKNEINEFQEENEEEIFKEKEDDYKSRINAMRQKLQIYKDKVLFLFNLYQLLFSFRKKEALSRLKKLGKILLKHIMK